MANKGINEKVIFVKLKVSTQLREKIKKNRILSTEHHSESQMCELIISDLLFCFFRRNMRKQFGEEPVSYTHHVEEASEARARETRSLQCQDSPGVGSGSGDSVGGSNQIVCSMEGVSNSLH